MSQTHGTTAEALRHQALPAKPAIGHAIATAGTKAACLEEALAAVSQRGQAYGAVLENFTDIAAIWTAILKLKVTPQQVAPCLVGLKIARLMHSPTHHDSCVDIAGYGACAAEIASHLRGA